jgi:hypothetical protein
MSNSNLIAVKRLNKNNVMVTRWVKPESVTGSNTAAISAPTLAKKDKPYKGFQSDHIAKFDDPRVQRGEIIDRIVDRAGRIFSRSRDGVTPDAPEFVRIQLNRPLLEEEEDRIAALVGYAWKTKMRPDKYANSVEVEDKDSPCSVILSVDLYRENPRSNEHRSLLEFQETLYEYMEDGTPIRTSDRAGHGTKDTRLLQGLEGADDLSFEVYYDSVEGDRASEIAAERGTTDIETLDLVLGHSSPALAEGML